MKTLLKIFILILSIQSLVKADDIRDFEIESISVGDTALAFFEKKEIDTKEKIYFPKSKKFFQITMRDNFQEYDAITIILKENDKNYIIHQITGVLEFPNDVKKCFLKQKEIKKELSETFPNIKSSSYDFIFPQDKSGKSKAAVSDFELNNGEVRVWCSDWSLENYEDNVQVSLSNKEFQNFIVNEAYN